MICPRCHRALRPNARFCPYCGAKVAAAPVAQRPPKQPVYRPPPQQRPPAQAWSQPPRRPVQRQVAPSRPPVRQQPIHSPRRPPQSWGQPPAQQRQEVRAEWDIQEKVVDPKVQLGQNYKSILLKSFVERKLKDDKIDQADLNEIERRYAEFLEAKARGQIVDVDDLALLEFRFRQLHIMALRELIKPSFLTETDVELLSRFENIAQSLDSLAHVSSDAIQLPGELDLIHNQLDGLQEALMDLDLLDNEGNEFDLNSRDLSKLKRILIHFHRNLQAYINRVKEISADLSLSLPTEFQLLEELDNFIQNELLIEKIDQKIAMEKIGLYMSVKHTLEDFMAKLQKVAVETDIEELKLKLMKNPKNLAHLEKTLEAVREAYGRQEQAKKDEAMRPYESSMQKSKPIVSVSSPESTLEKEEEPSLLPPLDPLPPLDELPELDPLQPFS